MITRDSKWISAQSLLVTRISGEVQLQDVELWKNSLKVALSQVADNSVFKMLIDLHGFKAADIQAHKKFREIIPLTLSRFGWRVGYLDMFPEASLTLSNERGIQCIAAAHVHHDATKINLYESKYSSPYERFFTDPQQAAQWIQNLNIEKISL